MFVHPLTGERLAAGSDGASAPTSPHVASPSAVAPPAAVDATRVSLHLVDTAGIKQSQLHAVGVGRSSVLWAQQAIADAYVTLLVIDAERGVQRQDKVIASYALDTFKSIVCVVNKWDLIKDRDGGATLQRGGECLWRAALPVWHLNSPRVLTFVVPSAIGV